MRSVARGVVAWGSLAAVTFASAVSRGQQAPSRPHVSVRERVEQPAERGAARGRDGVRGGAARREGLRAGRSATERACLGPVVDVRRAQGGFAWRGPLTDCRGRLRAEGLAGVSAVASPLAGARDASFDLSTLAAQIRRVAPVAGWTLAPDRASAGARSECPRGQEPIAAEVRAGEATTRQDGAQRGARQRGARVRCRAIEAEHDVSTRDVVLTGARRARVLHPRLVEMIARVAARWPGRTIEVVSGYRPSSNPHAGSRHAHARALDFRMVGVGREALRDFCRTLPLAGVGYYPHSVFVHLDVRDRSEGAARWTDYSEPGERPRYGSWPPRAEDVVREVRHLTARVDALLDAARSEQGAAEPASEPLVEGGGP
jgi:uncharacterized protein YcbK (DUF882 family)